MDDTAQDRKLPATQRKIDKARTEGQVARSRDLGHFGALGVGVGLLAAFAPEVTAWLGGLVAAIAAAGALILGGVLLVRAVGKPSAPKTGPACAHCGEALESAWVYCPFCGEKITVAEAVIESVPSAEKAAALEGK
mgnify:CR=1 FL=1